MVTLELFSQCCDVVGTHTEAKRLELFDCPIGVYRNAKTHATGGRIASVNLGTLFHDRLQICPENSEPVFVFGRRQVPGASWAQLPAGKWGFRAELVEKIREQASVIERLV